MRGLTIASPTSNSRLSERPARQERLRSAADLSAAEKGLMFRLMREVFQDPDRAQFEQDLAEKRWVLLLEDRGTGDLAGFSTLMRLDMVVDREPIEAYFSGDTVVRRSCWGGAAFPRLAAAAAITLSRSASARTRYWFLICSGFRTYRFLPLLFKRFYPAFDAPFPARRKRHLDALALRKFGARYDVRTGVIRPARPAALRPGISDITQGRLKNPHVAFFAKADPGHAFGDELACLAELRPDNLAPAALRLQEKPG